jgi:hypothetical protein
MVAKYLRIKRLKQHRLLGCWFIISSEFPTSYTKDFNLALALKTTTTTEPKFDFIDAKVFAIPYLFYLKFCSAVLEQSQLWVNDCFTLS